MKNKTTKPYNNENYQLTETGAFMIKYWKLKAFGIFYPVCCISTNKFSNFDFRINLN